MTEITPPSSPNTASARTNTRKIVQLLNRAPNLTGARHLLGHVVGALLLQIDPRLLKTLPTTGPCVIHGPARTPASSTSATATPASSRWRATTTLVHRGLSGARRPASAASCATSSPWARPGRHAERAALRRARASQDAPSSFPASSPASAATAIVRRADRRRRDEFPPQLQRQHPGQRDGVGLSRGRQDFSTPSRRRRQSVVYLGAKTGRDGIHGATMASAEFDDDSRGEAPDRCRSAIPSSRSCCWKPV